MLTILSFFIKRQLADTVLDTDHIGRPGAFPVLIK